MNALFLLDANVFIQSHRYNYPLDVATTFWNKLKMLANNQIFISIDKVKEEIYRKEDTIKEWCLGNISEDLFCATETPEIIPCYSKVINWATSMRSQYTSKAIEDFSEYKRADAWLIAFALKAKGSLTIITYEKSAPQAKSKIKIPDVCSKFGIKSTDIVGAFRKLGETF